MVTISDKRFGELVAKSLELEVYKDIANSQYEVIQRQLEASKLGMKRIKELENELISVRRDRDAWHAEYKMASGDLKHNREDVVSLVQERDALRDELEQVKAKLELAITLVTLFMVAAADKE